MHRWQGDAAAPPPGHYSGIAFDAKRVRYSRCGISMFLKGAHRIWMGSAFGFAYRLVADPIDVVDIAKLDGEGGDGRAFVGMEHPYAGHELIETA